MDPRLERRNIARTTTAAPPLRRASQLKGTNGITVVGSSRSASQADTSTRATSRLYKGPYRPHSIKLLCSLQNYPFPETSRGA